MEHYNSVARTLMERPLPLQSTVLRRHPQW
jgi:hypothetical protein